MTRPHHDDVDRRRAALFIAGLIALAAFVASPATGTSPWRPGAWPAWLERREAIEVLAAGCRVAALAAVLLLVPAVLGLMRPSGSAARWAPPPGPLRRRLLAVMGAAVVVSPAAAAPAPTAQADGPANGRTMDRPATGRVVMRTENSVGSTASGAGVVMRVDAPPSTAAPEVAMHTVQRGEHLWAIAERRLVEAWGRAPGDAEVTPYWIQLVEVNRARLVDRGNPDLILPGQQLVIPPVPADRASAGR